MIMATRITTEFDENDKKFIEKAVTEAANNYWNENKSELNQKNFWTKENSDGIEKRIKETEEEIVNKLKEEVNKTKERIHSQLKYWIVSIIGLIILIATASTVYSIREETKRVNDTSIEMQKSTMTLYEKLESFNNRIKESEDILVTEQDKLKEKVNRLTKQSKTIMMNWKS